MKSLILLTVFTILGYGILQGQVLKDCKNPCMRTRIVEGGPFIGLRTISLPDSQSVRVLEVIKNGASLKNGILLDDTLTHFNGNIIKNTNYFMAEVAKLQPGDTITLSVYREGLTTVYRYPLGALRSQKITEIVCCDEPEPLPELNSIAFVLSPAPAKDYLRVSTNEVLKMAVQFEIQDPNGKLVKSKKAKKPKAILMWK
ncbi:MAG: PDZ domain-containing protein [Bacteroidetes bacterium]|nr:PDZ domain-containing protein [Bacteroidota bacterium]